MKLPILLAVVATVSFGAPSRARAGERKCGAHQHESVEKNEDEGGTVKSCVCDEGWDATGPARPARRSRSRKRRPERRQATLRRRGSIFCRNCPV